MIVESILELVGNTPMVRVNRLNPNPNLEMFLKLEKFNPSGSVKDRITKYMVERAEKNGQLKEGMTVGPSSGAIFHIARKKAEEVQRGVMVIVAPDGGEKYLSTTLCDPALCLEAVRKYGIRCAYKDGKPITRAPTRNSKRQT